MSRIGKCIPSSFGAKKKPSRKEAPPAESADSAGALNPTQQLEAAYARLLKNEGADEAWRKEMFQKVRILVLGRSGVGKTTLIRLMVGKDGPQSVSEGIAGVQNINEEFLYSAGEQNVPLIIHDSNGMDVKGKQRVNEIKTFIDKHQKGGDFTERIHVVWYVISAIDPRCVDDCDVMQMISKYKIPSLLIMTHNDYDHDKLKVTDAVLNKLLQSAYAVEKERESVRKNMVKVGNDGVRVGANNELVIDESKRDMVGLKLVAQRTQQLMDKKLRNTWIAAQAVDMEGKLDRSAELIAGYARSALLTSLPRVIPLADPLKMTIIFWRVVVIMCQIWVVPPELNKAVNETLMHKEASCRVLRRIGEDTVYLATMVVAVGATLLTGGLALPAVIKRWKGSGQTVPVVVKAFSLQVLGTILYAKSAQEGSSKDRWRAGVTKEEYTRLCEEFAHNANYQKLLLDFARGQHSALDTAVRTGKVKGMMKSQIVKMYRRLLLDRPNSLFSLLANQETQTQAPPDPAHFDQLPDHVLDNLENCNNNMIVSSADCNPNINQPQQAHNIENFNNNKSASSIVHKPNIHQQQQGRIVGNFNNNRIASSAISNPNINRRQQAHNLGNFNDNRIASSASGNPNINQQLVTSNNTGNFNNGGISSSASGNQNIDQQLATSNNTSNYQNGYLIDDQEEDQDYQMEEEYEDDDEFDELEDDNIF